MKTGGKLWTEGKWHGHKNYKCAFCPFATLSERTIRKHVTYVHADEVAAARSERAAKPAPEKRRGRQTTAHQDSSATTAEETATSGNAN